jgi:hypothetical protein
MSSINPEKVLNQEAIAQAGLGEVVVLNSDLFFGVKIGNQLKKQGYAVAFRKTAGDFAAEIRATNAVLGLIDLNARPDWTEVSALVKEIGERTPILVFGSHLDVDGLRAAKASGVRRVVSNGEFHQNMIELVARYARKKQPAE